MRAHSMLLLALGLPLSVGACAQPGVVNPSEPAAARAEASAYRVQQAPAIWRWATPRRSAQAIENDIFSLVNRARRIRGRPLLTHLPAMRQVARRHSIDMVSKGYFAHNAPDGTHPAERMMAAGIPFGQSDEAIRTLSWRDNIAHDVLHEPGAGWLNDPNERSKLLRPSFEQMGVGVWRDVRTGNLYVTVLFIGSSTGGG